ncbi:protein of unknown function [Serratia sp. Tan611]|nr:protein of unknown function [Serratia sp. Tan611]
MLARSAGSIKALFEVSTLMLGLHGPDPQSGISLNT